MNWLALAHWQIAEFNQEGSVNEVVSTSRAGADRGI